MNVYKTEGGNYIIDCEFPNNKIMTSVENESQLRDIVEGLSPRDSFRQLKTDLIEKLHSKELDSFEELIPKPLEKIHIA